MFSLAMYQYPGTIVFIVRMELVCVCMGCMNNVLAMNNINTDHPEVLVHNVCVGSHTRNSMHVLRVRVLRFLDIQQAFLLYCVIQLSKKTSTLE